MKIGWASTAEIDLLWPLMAERFEHACRRCDSDLTAGELWQLCRSGNAFLCLVFNETGVRMASVWRFERKHDDELIDDIPVFRCLMMYGDGMKDWVDMAREWITGIARQNGAKKLVAEGRQGWLRLFNAHRNGIDYEVTI